ncbi:hypothetical protein K525DRAFT_272351 [Schizophyllum commune Loenen D]|nr:hypothetical protein K525DRAFT_272351 [Schizophyllum commune Loenen D]
MPVTTLVVGGLVAHFSLMVATVLFTSQAAHEEDRHPRSKTKSKKGPRSSHFLMINEFGGVGEGHEMMFKGLKGKVDDSTSKGSDLKGAPNDSKCAVKDATPKLKGAVKGAVTKAKEAVDKVKGAKRGSAKDEVAMKNMSGSDKELGLDAKPTADKDASATRTNRFARPAPAAQEDPKADVQTPPAPAPSLSAEKIPTTITAPASTTASDSESPATTIEPASKPETEDEEDSDSDDSDDDSDDSDDEVLEMITIPEEEAAAEVSFTKRQLQAKNLRPSTRLLRARYNFAHGDEYDEYLQDKAESQALDAELRASVHLPVDEKKRRKRLHNHYESDNITLRMLLIYMAQQNIEESLKSGDGEHKYYSVPA